MGGIVGEVALHGRSADLSTVSRMSEAMTRTPYGYGTCTWGWVALGHRRRRVVRGARTTAQPVVDDRLGLGIVLTGTVVNHHDLREELAGHHAFRSHADPEVALAAYHRWGEHFAERLEGAFALALVDAFRERVLLARDADGTIPLHLVRGPGFLRFASEREPLRAVGGLHPTADLPDLPPGTVHVIEPSGRRTRRAFGAATAEPVDPLDPWDGVLP
ncbi:hypothetical protein E7744_13935 [Citricoccus sp. SGAir0253]|uniref:hypothetical protein n=1 Tax=Citricoccus sp. SGAir0253 TaxID=2567881 RepID=UPI0010CCF423|nr:hypothetical protein [Citricoccus sp. SGAir0253]QCU79108.1 hypothetical protein E7744_13935 [Citricoccus sp. SGAir0253]